MDDRTNQPDAPLPLDVASLLLAHVGDERDGLVFDDRPWTWDAHVRESATRAAWLDAVRVDGPFHVGVLLDNVPDFSFLLGAAALGGAVIVGLNPTRRGPELAADIARTDCQLIVTESRHRALLDAIELPIPRDRVLDVDDPVYAEVLAPFRDAPLPSGPPPDPSALLMLIFTSGTSGRPKAVRVTHRKVAGPAQYFVSARMMSAADRVYVSMPMFHSACVMAAWGPCLATGATILLRRRFSASGFLPDIRRLGATYFHYVGKPLSYILATPPTPDDLDNELRIANGNEASEVDIERFARRFGCTVIDGFGSTEGGVNLGRTPDTPPAALGPLPDGVAILDPATGAPVETSEFDDAGRLLNPDRAIGELVNTTGAGAFEGYYEDDDATAERMRDGMYWSGDLGYRDAAGYVYFAGRSIEWMRVDGENFTAAPIERILARHPSVSQVAVYAVPAADVGDQVMATVKLHDGHAFDPDEFRAFFEAQPDAGTKWLPTFVRVAATLPETRTNKVQKRLLASDGWRTNDPVWWIADQRDARCYVPMTAPDKTALLERFRANRRDHVLGAG